jgi:hypothetical protein
MNHSENINEIDLLEKKRNEEISKIMKFDQTIQHFLDFVNERFGQFKCYSGNENNFCKMEFSFFNKNTRNVFTHLEKTSNLIKKTIKRKKKYYCKNKKNRNTKVIKDLSISKEHQLEFKHDKIVNTNSTQTDNYLGYSIDKQNEISIDQDKVKIISNILAKYHLITKRYCHPSQNSYPMFLKRLKMKIEDEIEISTMKY